MFRKNNYWFLYIWVTNKHNSESVTKWGLSWWLSMWYNTVSPTNNYINQEGL